MLRRTFSVSAFRDGTVSQGCGGARAISVLSALKGYWLRLNTKQRSAHGTVWEDENRCVE